MVFKCHCDAMIIINNKRLSLTLNTLNTDESVGIHARCTGIKML